MSSAPLPDDVSSAPLPDDVSSAPLPDDVSSAPLLDDVSSTPLLDDVSSALQRNRSYLFEVSEATNRSTRQLVLIYLSFWLISLVPLTADDMQMTPGVVLHEIGQLRQVSGWCSGWHMSFASEISPEISLLCHLQVICTSSAGHLHVVHTRLQSPKYFKLNTRATALLINPNVWSCDYVTVLSWWINHQGEIEKKVTHRSLPQTKQLRCNRKQFFFSVHIFYNRRFNPPYL